MNRASHNQMKKLLELMSENGVLQNGKLVYLPQSNKNIFWRRITMQLNAVEGGVYKNMWKWSKKSETIDNVVNTSAEYFIIENQSDLEDTEPRLQGINHLEDSKYNEESSDFTLLENNEEADVSTEFDEDQVYTKNSSEKNCKMRKNDKSLEDLSMGNIDNINKYKLKVRLSIEKERLRQKREELRLRAIELKMRGDEIRLKEAEMKKINCLTNVEEEKLKCFREIASMLKELLERMKDNNTPKYNNLI